VSLRESIKALSGNKRRFFLLRIADIEARAARDIVGITLGTYNSWFQDERFVELYRQRDEFNANNKQEAIQLLRRDNQLEAVFLEGKILAKMKEELDTGEYNLACVPGGFFPGHLKCGGGEDYGNNPSPIIFRGA